MHRLTPLRSTQCSHRYEEEIVPRQPHTKCVREGQYGAEVDVELIDDEVDGRRIYLLKMHKDWMMCGRHYGKATSSEQRN
jgi:hypothetical protein